MTEKNQIMPIENIQNHIFTIRGVQVMLDSDLAKIYKVETKNLNRAVSRNIERFPEKFRFQLTQLEFDEYEKSLRFQIGTLKNKDQSLKSQNAILKKGRGQHSKYLPYVFTEQGVSMLSAVLRSETAIKVSILIIEAFVEMRKFISENAAIFQRLEKVEIKQIETDQKFEQIFTALEDKSIKPKQGIFYDGQIFDAYVFVADLIRSAKNSILLIDNYVDESVLELFTKRNKNVSVIIYTKNITQTLKQDLTKYNSQYQKIEIKKFSKSHDRFLIIDDKELYHLGASLKDLGKKWFAFSKMEIDALNVIANLQ
ncbi:MAG: ORF6N domain-containing protein [Kiritimatiellae bacterium]|nr:ORF6N domain-containing protein [Kiritimatiellia bacterium]